MTDADESRGAQPTGEDDRNASLPDRDDPEACLPADVESVRAALVEWYEGDHREYPWRETHDPYPILVSEVMSQQTQLDRVVEPWREFTDRWPTVEALAAADRAEVVGLWTDHSLGYNNRAKYLHEAAEQVVSEHGGEFPETPKKLQELMGVGPYTADAVASFAFDNGGAVVDTNVKRVLYRAFDIPDEDSEFERVAGELMPNGDSRVWNNAIMELGGVACQKTPQCDEEGCPWREWCHAYGTGDFRAPDVPTQPEFEGSRRQMRGRVVSVLREYGKSPIDDLGRRVRVDYAPGGEYGREWLQELLSDLESDGLVTTTGADGETVARLRR